MRVADKKWGRGHLIAMGLAGALTSFIATIIANSATKVGAVPSGTVPGLLTITDRLLTTLQPQGLYS